MIIAHDLGTTGNKASLHRDDGSTVHAVTVSYPVDFRVGGIAEQDPLTWWNAVGEATRSLLAVTGVGPSEVSVVGMSGQMMGAVFLDGNHRPVRPAMIWADHRSVAQAVELQRRVGMAAGYVELGHRIDPTYSLTKVMWLRDHEPDSFRRTRYVCQAKDYVVALMTGTLVTDPSDASSTNAYAQRTGVWSTLLLDAAGIEAELFPPIVPATTVVGGLTAPAAAHLGLVQGTAVVIGGGDGPMAATGAGVIAASDPPYVSMGSSSWISCAATSPLHDPQMRTMTFDHVVPGHYVPTATMQAGGASLSWVMDLFGGTDEVYARLLAEAAGVSAADEDLFFLPHLLGERSPYWNPRVAGGFIGVKRHHGPAHLVRAVLEGVAFNLRTCKDALTDNGITVGAMDVIGGGARSDTWMQIFADVWQVPVRRRSIVEEANSLGAAITAAVGVGLVPGFDAARSLSHLTATFEPDTSRAAILAAQYESFVDSYYRLEPWFAGDRQDRAHAGATEGH
ncbi:FGGY-family carbohydrate kinase [Nakamurella sp. A5-74]|uniref:FGGY-family carbohydrate kinase n=1 Tax=Nakamurella sp. A5-74 TaxID=3158264 RepID=A0AAU8DPB9_9ACTN